MPLTDARLGPGTLKLGAPLTDYSFQIANAALEPDVSEEDGTPTLATPAPAPLATVGWNLTGTAIQDFTNAAATGLQNYLMDHALQTVAFEFVPNTADGTKYSGTCQLRPATIGGDAGVQITTDFSFPVVGAVVRVDGVFGDETEILSEKGERKG
jgi:hypothetical protein